jgi:hypothetical protein
MPQQYIIYCDESQSKGRFYSNLYGGAIIKASDRVSIGSALLAAKNGITGEAKWIKITEQDEDGYITFSLKFLELLEAGLIKMRVMFTQNIHSTDHVQYYDQDAKYFKLYYQFIKHAFGLMFCNDDRKEIINVSVHLDDAPDTSDALDNFKDYLASLTVLPDFFRARVIVDRDAIAEVDSRDHMIMQAVDVILGAIQFRLNELHKEIPRGKKRRGKRTRAKERVYKSINAELRAMYPHFNIGVTTGQAEGQHVRWTHPYRHWCDHERGKRQRRR